MRGFKLKEQEDIYVIGFPKSGNTWLARLLAEVTDSNLVPSNPVDAADYSLERKADYLIHKKHIVDDIQTVVNSKTVYIVRDVRDVLISGFFHCNRWCTNSLIKNNVFVRWYFNHEIRRLNNMWQSTIWGELKYSLIRFITSLVRKKSPNVSIGSWSHHVNKWTKDSNVVVIRYEDLLDDTEVQVRKLLDVLKLDVHDDILKQAVLNQSFKKKKAAFIESGDLKNSQFLREGKTNGWKELLPREIVKEIEIAHANMMNKFAYKAEYFEGSRK